MDLLKYLAEMKIVDQEIFNKTMNEALAKIQNPTTLQQMEYTNTINGGHCSICNKEWIEFHVSEKYRKYKYFKPGCECIEKADKESRFSQLEQIFNRNSNIPDKYYNCNLKGMDLEIHPDTVAAIVKVKQYLKEKRYLEKGLILYGDIGTGKTHIAIAVMKNISITHKWYGQFINTSELITKIITDNRGYLQELLSNNIILLDDMDKANIGNDKSNSGWIAEQFFTLINGITSRNKILIATNNLKSRDEMMEKYDSAIISRLIGSCEFIQILGDDYRMKGK